MLDAGEAVVAPSVGRIVGFAVGGNVGSVTGESVGRLVVIGDSVGLTSGTGGTGEGVLIGLSMGDEVP